jgi:hypothetical protein
MWQKGANGDFAYQRPAALPEAWEGEKAREGVFDRRTLYKAAQVRMRGFNGHWVDKPHARTTRVGISREHFGKHYRWRQPWEHYSTSRLRLGVGCGGDLEP